MKILHVSCSPRGPASQSYQLSQQIIAYLLKKAPTAVLVDRVISGGELQDIDADFAFSQHGSEDVSQRGTARQSEELIQELENADCVVIATPMHNFTAPAALKLWLDHIVRVRRTFNVSREGKVGLLRDRPVFVAVASGGKFSGQGARQPDFLTPYLKAVLSIIGLRDVTFFSVQGTALGPEVVAAAKSQADQALREHFADIQLDAPSTRRR